MKLIPDCARKKLKKIIEMQFDWILCIAMNCRITIIHYVTYEFIFFIECGDAHF